MVHIDKQSKLFSNWKNANAHKAGTWWR